ncbi:hypothetical protein [Bacillus thuringiensis]|uniref:hypothetical protein n=1 Tax=Bacillus thuringiensis TaxID=1428 RepID=UPI00159BA2F6|nr:hypothetical protein [Bacillus thuringiensis]
MTTKKKKEMRKIADERGCKCGNSDYWFQLREGTVGCNECESLLITDTEYKEKKKGV